MAWNHRVIESTATDGSKHYTIHEVYYNADGEPHLWTAEPVSPYGETLAVLADEIGMFARACLEPVLRVEGDKLATLPAKV